MTESLPPKHGWHPTFGHLFAYMEFNIFVHNIVSSFYYVELLLYLGDNDWCRTNHYMYLSCCCRSFNTFAYISLKLYKHREYIIHPRQKLTWFASTRTTLICPSKVPASRVRVNWTHKDVWSPICILIDIRTTEPQIHTYIYNVELWGRVVFAPKRRKFNFHFTAMRILRFKHFYAKKLHSIAPYQLSIVALSNSWTMVKGALVSGRHDKAVRGKDTGWNFHTHLLWFTIDNSFYVCSRFWARGTISLQQVY